MDTRRQLSGAGSPFQPCPLGTLLKSLALEGKCSYPLSHLAGPFSFFFDWHVIVLVIYSLGFPDIDRNRNCINSKIKSILRKHGKQKMVEGRGESVLEGLSEKSLPLCQATQCLKKNKWKGEK